MSKQTQAPERDGKLGVWTPEYFIWAYRNMSDDEFCNTYRRNKERGILDAKDDKVNFGRYREALLSLESDEEEVKIPEKPEESAEESPVEQMAIDAKEMHHKKFQAKYGISLKEYKEQQGGDE